jgi:RING-H2 zinc finger domain
MALPFDRKGPKCYKIRTFYRLCGHVITGYRHTDLCVKAIEDKHPPGYAGLPFCWCPFPLGKHLQYIVGLCGPCQREREHGVKRHDQPHRNVQHGTQTTMALPITPYTPELIRADAANWRLKIEEQERMTRTERLKREREAESRRKAREAEWNLAWDAHRSTTKADFPAPVVHEDAWKVYEFHRRRTAQILDLTDDYSRPREPHDLLEIAHDVDPEDDCLVCQGKFSEPPLCFDDGVKDLAVHFQGGCSHIFHRKCIIKYLTDASGNRHSCPLCRTLYQVVLKCGFEDPKFRWIMQHPRDNMEGETAKHKLRQVSGYIPFDQGLFGKGEDKDKNFFKPFDQEDRWGDREALDEQ